MPLPEVISYFWAALAVFAILGLLRFGLQCRKVSYLKNKLMIRFGQRIVLRMKLVQRRGSSSKRKLTLRPSLEIFINANCRTAWQYEAHKTGTISQKAVSMFFAFARNFTPFPGDIVFGPYTLVPMRATEANGDAFKGMSPELRYRVVQMFDMGFRSVTCEPTSISARIFGDEWQAQRSLDGLYDVPAVLFELSKI